MKKLSKSVSTKSMTFVADLLDASSSMASIRSSVLTAYNQITNGFLLASEESKMPLSMFLYMFHTYPTLVYSNTAAEDLVPFVGYSPIGATTHIFRAIERTINDLTGYGKDTKDAYLVNIYTDGQDNSYDTMLIVRVVERMAKLTTQGNWTFTFQVPVGHKFEFCSKFKIPSGNVREWEQNEQGTHDMATETVKSAASYMSSRAVGRTQSLDYFQPDLSKVSATKVKRALDVVTPQYRPVRVAGEARIDEFVSSKTKKAYVVGSSYYQLTKTETIQDYKNILLIKKGNAKLVDLVVYGGDGVRELLGMPTAGSVKCIPGNYGDWDIFVQSTSVNRKLVRGTLVLIDKDKIHDNVNTTFDKSAESKTKAAALDKKLSRKLVS
jgi:hypothetical protein